MAVKFHLGYGVAAIGYMTGILILTNLLERAFGESRRRTKVIPCLPGERACLTLLFATLITAAARWRGVRMTPQILRALDALRPEEAPRKDKAAA